MTIASGSYSLKETNKEGERSRTIDIRQVAPFFVSFGERSASMAQRQSTRKGCSRERRRILTLDCVTGCRIATRCQWLCLIVSFATNSRFSARPFLPLLPSKESSSSPNLNSLCLSPPPPFADGCLGTKLSALDPRRQVSPRKNEVFFPPKTQSPTKGTTISSSKNMTVRSSWT